MINETIVRNFILHQKLKLECKEVEKHKFYTYIEDAFNFAFPGDAQEFKKSWRQMEHEGLV